MRLKAAWSLITPQLVVVQQVLVLEGVWVHLLIRSRLLCWLVLKGQENGGRWAVRALGCVDTKPSLSQSHLQPSL